LPEGYWPALQARFASGDQAALIGLPLGDFNTGYSNSVLGLKPALSGQAALVLPEPYRYDKHHLVPFGEVIPPGFHWFIRLMNIPLGDFNRGAVGQPSFAWQGQRLAPNICYEDLFGEELAARFVDARQAPTVFVNVSNIAWFGNTVAIDQHLQISRMRALEFGRPMIRATNTGATVIIDRRGKVTHSLPPHTRDVLNGEVQGRSGITPYAWWAGRFGLWPLWGLGLAALGLALRFRRRG
jgi:apolipoprotein N-acyltransferase